MHPVERYPSCRVLPLLLLFFLTLLTSCASVKKISQYKLADKPETAHGYIEKSLKYLTSESDSADFRAQLYDSMSHLSLKFKLSTTNPVLYGKVRAALFEETGKVLVAKQVPSTDITYLHRLAVTKLGELGEVSLLRDLVERGATGDAEIAATALAAVFDNTAELRKNADLVMSLMRASDRVLARQDLAPPLAEKLAAERASLNEQLLDLDLVTKLLSSKKTTTDEADTTTMLKLLDWNYTLLRNADAKGVAPSGESVANNLAALASLGFATGMDSRSVVAARSRAILAGIAPFYALERTVDSALAGVSSPEPVYDHAGEVFSFFAAKPFPTDPPEQNPPPGAPRVMSADQRGPVLAKVVKLAIAVSGPDMAGPLRAGAYGTLARIAPLEFAETVARRASLCRGDETMAMEMLSLLNAALLSPEIAAERRLLDTLRTETARFAAMPSPRVLEATAGILLESAPEKLLTGLQDAVERMDGFSAEQRARLAEIYMTVVARMEKKKQPGSQQLDSRRLSRLFAMGGDSRSTLLRFVVDREPDTAVRLSRDILNGMQSKDSGDALYHAKALVEILAKRADRLESETVTLAVRDLYQYISAESDEEAALHIARVLLSVNHPRAYDALAALVASGGARSPSLSVMLESASRRMR